MSIVFFANCVGADSPVLAWLVWRKQLGPATEEPLFFIDVFHSDLDSERIEYGSSRISPL